MSSFLDLLWLFIKGILVLLDGLCKRHTHRRQDKVKRQHRGLTGTVLRDDTTAGDRVDGQRGVGAFLCSTPDFS
jgi:hypothetical protein